MDISKIILFTRTLPQSNLLLFIFFLFKFAPIISNVNSHEHISNNKLSEKQIFTKLTNYSLLNRYNLNHINVEILWIVLYFIIWIPIVSALFVYYNSNKKLIAKNLSILITGVSYVFLWIIWFSQHILECLFFNVCLFFYTKTPDDSILHNLENENSKLLYSNYATVCINLVFIVVINGYVFIFFKLFNQPFLSDKYVFTHKHNNVFIVWLTILFNSQCIHYYDWIFDTTVFKYTISIITWFLWISLLLIYHQDYIEKTFYNYLLLFLIVLSVITGVFSIIINSIDIRDKAQIPWYYIGKYIFCICLTYGLIIKYFSMQTKKYNLIVIRNLFKSQKENRNFLPYLIGLFGTVNYWSDIIKLYELLNNHISFCTNGEDCEHKYININESLNHVKQHSNDQAIRDILILTETEIHNYIATGIQLHVKSKSILPSITLLHCNFVFTIWNNPYKALYWIDGYTNKLKDIPYEYTLYFATLKKNILDSIQKPSGEVRNEFEKKYHLFMKYFRNITQIKKEILQCVINYQKIIGLKWIYNDMNNSNKNNISAQNNNKNLQLLFNTCMTVDKCWTILRRQLIANFGTDKINNPEIYYLLTHFYKIVLQRIPSSLKDIIIPVADLLPITQLPSSYSQMQFEHPVVVSMGSCADSVNQVKGGKNSILYISQKLVRDLSYRSTDLIGEDFHIWLPEYFHREHSIEMENQFFIHQQLTVCKTIFLVDKDNCLINACVNGTFLPQMANELTIILDISLITKSKRFEFILDCNFQTICISKSFTEDYSITNEMMKLMKITFCNFFGLHQENLQKQFTEEIKKLSEVPRKYSLELFDNTKFKRNLDLYKESWLDNNNKNNNDKQYENNGVSSSIKSKITKKIKFDRPKSKLKVVLNRMQQQMEENEISQDIRDKITALYNNLFPSTNTMLGANENQIENIKSEDLFNFSVTFKAIGTWGYYDIIVKDKNSSIFLTTNKTLHLRENHLNPALTDGNSNYLADQNGPTLVNITENIAKNYNDLNSTAAIQKSLNDSQQKLIFNKTTNNAYDKDWENTLEMKEQKKQIYYLNTKATLDYYEKKIIIAIMGFMGVGVVLFCFNFYYKTHWITVVEDSLQVSIICLQLKENWWELFNASLSGFLILDNIEPTEYHQTFFTMEFIKVILSIGSSSLFKAYNDLLSYIEKYSHYSGTQEIQEIWFREQTFMKIRNDHSEYLVKSDLNTELYYLHFYSGFAGDKSRLTECQIQDKFFFKNNTEPWNEDEILFYYISNNASTNIIDLIEEIIIVAHAYVINQFNDCKNKTTIYNCALVILGFFVCILQFIFEYLKQLKLKLAFGLFFEPSQKTKKLDFQLMNLKTIIEKNDEEIWVKYEQFSIDIEDNYNKSDKFDIAWAHNISSSISTNRTNPKDKLNTKRKGKESKSSKHVDDDRVERNNKNSSKPRNEKGGIIESKEIELIKLFNWYTINIIALCLIFTTVITITYFVVILLNLSQSVKQYNQISSTFEMANIFLDRIPSFNEILLFYRICILYNNPYYSTRSRSSYPEYLSYFLSSKLTSIVIEDDYRFNLLGDSKMAFWYYRLNYQYKLVSTFENSNKKFWLTERNKFSVLVAGSNACDAIGDYLLEYISSNDDERALVEDACMNLENGVNNKGTGTSINSFYVYLLDFFVEYVNLPDRNDWEKVLTFWKSDLVTSISRQMFYVLNISWLITQSLLQVDINNWFKSIKNTEFMFALIEMVMASLLIIGIVYLVIFELSRKVRWFEKIIQRLNNVIK